MNSKEIRIKGIVQGVGFRPFVYTLAKKNNITGWVRNSSAGVEIIANGSHKNLSEFTAGIKSNPPPLAKIDEFTESDISTEIFKDFSILSSQTIPGEFIPVSPDMSICKDCQEELFDPNNHRYRYPFINCTNCGPRLTIIQDMPYDRPNTTMANFAMCDQCMTEYENPLDRRFHAQPIACPQCGPHVWFECGEKRVVTDEEAIQQARNFLKNGMVIAIKGLGGFHLACNALDTEAVNNLRQRKLRSDKSFATMAFDIRSIEKYCEISGSENILLESPQRPIVILKQKTDTKIPDQIAPGMKTLGVMLAYTPLHLLLLEPKNGFPDLLVMTSGNISDEPIVYTNESAKETLGPLADGFLLHDREINTRVDDSVTTEFKGNNYFFRRSRGYAPNAISLPKNSLEILAVGAELKNTFCLTKEKYAFISHHIGDLKNIETYQAFTDGIENYKDMFTIKPELIACDIHPDYLSTKFANIYSHTNDIPLVQVQHHHAHLAACLADNKWETDENVIGIIFDGTGFGLDRQIWGGEILIGGYQMAQRRFHLEYMPLPGGDAAIFHPNRIAAAYLLELGLPWEVQFPSIESLSTEERSVLKQQLKTRLNTPFTSSMGRLFDAVASLIGLRHDVNYEAQAAIELEQISDTSITDSYTFNINDETISFKSLIADILNDQNNNIPAGIISSKFHNAVANLVLDLCKQIKREINLTHVALSGGVWQNQILLRKSYQFLLKEGFSVLIHHDIPANDGGISLGQAVIASRQHCQ
ncbi:MAG: carbamoyltransferase HypF [Pelolinea sp.]|nr:carbamoyltransferase HypF [Pelolinea sp.]